MKPCIKCGAVDRTKRGDCRPCARERWVRWCAENPEYFVKWRAENIDRVRVQNTKWRAKNPEYDANWCAKNPEKVKESKVKYRTKNPEKCKEASAKYRAENQEKEKTRQRKYRDENPEKEKARKANWRAENPKMVKTQQANWRSNNHDKMQESNAIQKSKRRCLGFVPLNKIFEGSEGHHITANYVIFIPRELHRSVYHNFFKGTNMKEINALAFDYLCTSATI
jgi:hypothetical protein